jgi:hypothetical protein
VTLTHQFCLDFSTPVPHDQALEHPQPVRVLEVIEMTAPPAAPELFYGIFLPQRLREDLSRRNRR